MGARMRQIISVIYGVLLIAIWLCVMGIVIAVLDSGGPKWLLAAAGFVAAVSTVALAEEFVEWRSRPKAKASPDTTRDFDTGKLVTDDMPQ
jgi:pilus assembly protein TadC